MQTRSRHLATNWAFSQRLLLLAFIVCSALAGAACLWQLPALAGSGPAPAGPPAPGELDLSFGVNGSFTTTVASDNASLAGAFTNGDDTAILVINTERPEGINTSAINIAVTNADMAPITRTQQITMGVSTVARTAAQQTDGKIVIVGELADAQGRYVLISRVNPDGLLDESFGTSGVITSTLLDFGAGIAVQPDGQIIVTGSTVNGGTGEDIAAIRLDDSGQLDTSFGSNGLANITVTNGTDRAHDVAITDQNLIMVVGQSASASGVGDDLAVVSFTESGQPNPNFGAGGFITRTVGFMFTDFSAALDEQQGRIVVAGSSAPDFPPTTAYMHIDSFTLSGQADPTFSDDGVLTVTVGLASLASAIEIDDNSNLLISGASFNGSESPQGGSAAFTMIRLQPNGTLDPTFATNGIQVTDLGPTYDYANAIFRLNGFIYLGGQADQLPGPGPGRLVVAFAR
ncbi:MAG: hypothetical protein KDE28_25495, partial [Anaerolineales bacterium]|nr:hypothetical protein [Anaerolineales bacterium]